MSAIHHDSAIPGVPEDVGGGNAGSTQKHPSFPTFGRLPQGIQLLRRDGMNPLLEQQLERASRSNGRHMTVCFVVDDLPKGGAGGTEGATINMVRVNGDGWSFDWLYRALRMLEEDIRKIPVPGMTGTVAAADESAAPESNIAKAANVQDAGEVA